MHPTPAAPYPCVMSPRELLPPTAEEAHALASLALNPAFSSYETILSLQGVLDFISHADIFNFLFTEDPVHLRHIAMPDVPSKSIAGHFIKTRVEPGNCSKDSLSCHASGSYLLMPAFTINHTTFGFGIHTFFDTASRASCQRRPSVVHTAESRFVKNESTGILLKVIDSEQSGLITVEYSCMSSLTRIARSSATFNRNQFRSVLRAGTLDMPHVLSCISEFYTSNQYRRCPICARPHKVCNCTMQFSEPRHPFDNNAFLNNMTLRFGRFVGVGDVTCYENGRDSRKASLGCRLVIDGELNMSKVEQMRSAVIEKHLSRVNPLNFFLRSAAQLQVPNALTSAGEQPHEDILSELISKQDERKTSPSTNLRSDASWLLGASQTAVDIGLPFDEQDSIFPDDFGMFIPKGEDLMQALHSKDSDEQKCSIDSFENVPKALLSPVTPPSTSSQCSDEEEVLRLRKLEKRKARNRASAMRSHLKKKAFIDGLKQELNRNHDNILHLRSREMMLRKENLRLRKLLAKD